MQDPRFYARHLGDASKSKPTAHATVTQDAPCICACMRACACTHSQVTQRSRRRALLAGATSSYLHGRYEYLALPHLTLPHLTLPHLTSPHLTSPHLTSLHLTSPYLTSPWPCLALPCLDLPSLCLDLAWPDLATPCMQGARLLEGPLQARTAG